eukprot:c40886_g1_i1.p1 GENE.c40886_g1_i1~~c40886_g1_i1.p1  ORF type:complete len:128 (-),score=33.62 c40886_g1_i1:35-418(-)
MADDQSRRTLYVGGLGDEVTEADLREAFIPFGDLVTINLPLDPTSQKHKAFCFIEFEEYEDAKAAIENMNEAELFGKVLKVNQAKAQRDMTRPVWSQDEYLVKRAQDIDRQKEEQASKRQKKNTQEP